MPFSTSENDLSYMAGLLDGEGCIYIGLRQGYHALSASVVSLNRAVLDWAATKFGGSVRNRTNGAYKPVSVWSLGSSDTIKLLSAIRPWARIKAAQVWLALEYDAQRDNSYGTTVTNEEFALREGFRLALKEAKRTG